MPQQGIDLWLTPSERDEQVHGVARAALFENILQKRAAGLLIENATLLEQGNPKKAQGYFQRALDVDPSAFSTWTNLAESFVELGQKGRARECLDVALEIKPNFKYGIKLRAKLR